MGRIKEMGKYEKLNRTTTANSLEAVFLMLTAKNKEDFCFYYKNATHDNQGASTWFYMNKIKEDIK